MADKLGKLMQALEAGKAKERLDTQGTVGIGGELKGLPKIDAEHTWKTSTFGTIGRPRAKKRGSGKY